MSTRTVTARKTEVAGRADSSRAPIMPDGERWGAGAAADAPPGVTPDRIRARAYEIFQARNGGGGDALADWLRAERELNG